MAVGRTLVSLSDTLPLGSGPGSPMFLLMAVGLFMMVSAYGLYQPAAYAGVKRYTTPKTAAMGYAVLYALMNLGAFLFGWMSPPIRRASESAFPPNGLGGVLWAVTVITALSCVLTLILITRKVDRSAVDSVARETRRLRAASGEVPAEAAPEGEEAEPVSRTHVPMMQNVPFLIFTLLGVGALVLTLGVFYTDLRLVGGVTDRILAVAVTGVLAVLATWDFVKRRPDHPFRDGPFVFFIFILIPVQTLFAHNWLTIPYYLDRAFTGTWVSANFELLSNLNPILIFFLTPLVAGLTARANEYKMMILGTFVMAAPTFLLVPGPNAWMFVLYIVLMSIGEAIWQPRFLQWIAEIAPPGRTGAYMGIGQFPWFLTKVVTGFYSGYFVANYIPQPESGMELKTGEMWLYYSLIAMVTPIALLFAKRWMMSRMLKAR
jgi:hypothetical protein